jgi:hypothetical protein
VDADGAADAGARVSCFDNGVKAETFLMPTGVGILLDTVRIFKPDGTLCYQRTKSPPYNFAYTDATGTEIAHSAPNPSLDNSWTFVCDGVTLTQVPLGACHNNEVTGCAMAGVCQAPP